MFAMVPAALLQNEDLTANEKIVVTALLLHRNQKSGACYPGIARISRLSSLSIRTVKRVISSLEKKGIIERKRRFTDCGDPDTNSYSMGGWCHSDTTWCQDDPRVVSEWHDGWCHGDTLTENLNREKEQKNPSSQSLLEPKPKPIGEIRAEEVQSAFSEFWNLYPKKQGKRAALAEFSKLCPLGMEPDRLNQRFQNVCGQAVLYADSVQGTEARYVKSAVNWLRECDPDEQAIIEEEVWVRAEEAE